MRNKGCVQPHLFAAYLHRRRVRLSGFRRQGISSAAGGFSSTLFRSGSVPNNCSKHYIIVTNPSFNIKTVLQ
ncbi:MAG: hypothetical protein ACK53Y_11920, partial [bacterium]